MRAVHDVCTYVLLLLLPIASSPSSSPCSCSSSSSPSSPSLSMPTCSWPMRSRISPRSFAARGDVNMKTCSRESKMRKLKQIWRKGEGMDESVMQETQRCCTNNNQTRESAATHLLGIIAGRVDRVQLPHRPLRRVGDGIVEKKDRAAWWCVSVPPSPCT